MATRGLDGPDAAELSVPGKGTFAVVAVAAARDRRLGRCTPLHVLVAIAKYNNPKTGLCVPAVETIAADLGLKRRAVQQHIATLIEGGYLVARGRRRVNGGWSSNGYTLLFPGLPDAPQDADGGGGGDPTGFPEDAPSEPLMASASDAQPSCAYPPHSVDGVVHNTVDSAPPMRSLVAHGSAAELRMGCATELRMNNNTNLTIDSNDTFAEANARARATGTRTDGGPGEGVALVDEPQDQREGGGASLSVACGVQTAKHEAIQVVPLARARPMHHAPRVDPLGALVKRLSSQTGIPEHELWVHALNWHERLVQTGIGDADAQRIIVAIGRPLGHGKLSGDPVMHIEGRVGTWITRRVVGAAA